MSSVLSGVQERRRHGAGTLAPTRIPFTIGGLGAAVPATRISNHDLESQVATTDQWIVERTGIRERRVVATGQATSDLATAAGRAALADAGTSAAALDLVVVATCTPDQPLPATAAYVARDLDVRCAAFDLAAACSGWVYGLVTVASILTATGGQGALLIGAEVLSQWMDPADRGTLPLFGDAAAAAVLWPAAGRDGPGLVAWDLGIDGDGADLLRVPGGGSRLPTTAASIAAGEHYMKMSGREVFRRAVRSVETSCQAVLDSSGVAPSDIALFVPHQANARIVEAILPRLDLSAEQTVMNIDRYGNTSSASVPLALCEAASMGRLADGDLVLLAGFGAGMTWASALIRWGYTGGGPGLPAVLPS